MNKNIIILPLAVVAMGLTSCNKGFSRHSLKESDRDSVVAIIKNLEKNKQISKTGGKLKALLDTQKATFSLKNTRKCTTKMNGILGENISESKEITAYLDVANNTGKLDYKFSGITGDPGYREKQDTANYIKLTDNKVYQAQQDNIVGTKTKKQLKDGQDPLQGYNADIASVLYGCRSGLIDKDVYYIADIMGNEKYALDFTGGIDKTDIPYQPEPPAPIVENLLEYANMLKDKATVKYGSNDENSCSISIKGSLTAKDYFDIVSPAPYSKCEGKVELDYFVCVEDKFLTQVEASIKYIDITMQYEGQKDVLSISAENYAALNFDYKNGQTVEVNLDEFILDD